jgi:hypothetical protein
MVARVPGRLCLECTHCRVEYEGAHSSWTPGEGLDISCRARVRLGDEAAPFWELEDMSAAGILTNIRRAETCPVFERDPDVGGNP